MENYSCGKYDQCNTTQAPNYKFKVYCQVLFTPPSLTWFFLFFFLLHLCTHVFRCKMLWGDGAWHSSLLTKAVSHCQHGEIRVIMRRDTVTVCVGENQKEWDDVCVFCVSENEGTTASDSLAPSVCVFVWVSECDELREGWGWVCVCVCAERERERVCVFVSHWRMISLWSHTVALFTPGSAAYTHSPSYTQTHISGLISNLNKTTFWVTIE